MKWYNTREWLIKPNFRYSFRIGNKVFVCRFKFFHWVLLQPVGLVQSERTR